MIASPKPANPPPTLENDVFERLAQSESLLTAAQVAQLLTIKPKTVYAYASRNLIPHYKIEASIRFRGKDVAEWLRNHAVYAAGARSVTARTSSGVSA
jgi:excisionase family DNA binding protein